MKMWLSGVICSEQGYLRSHMSKNPRNRHYKNGINNSGIYKLALKKSRVVVIVQVQNYTSVILPLMVMIMISPMTQV